MTSTHFSERRECSLCNRQRRREAAIAAGAGAWLGQKGEPPHPTCEPCGAQPAEPASAAEPFVRLADSSVPVARSEAAARGYHDPCDGSPWRQPPAWDPLALSSPAVWAEVESTERFLAERRATRKWLVWSNRLIALQVVLALGGLTLDTIAVLGHGATWSEVLGWNNYAAWFVLALSLGCRFAPQIRRVLDMRLGEAVSRPRTSPDKGVPSGVISGPLHALRNPTKTIPPVAVGDFEVYARAIHCAGCGLKVTAVRRSSQLCSACLDRWGD